jgi:hypothetical protein
MIPDPRHLRYMLTGYLTIHDLADEIVDKVNNRVSLQSLLIAILELSNGIDAVATGAYECRELPDIRHLINGSMNKGTLRREEALRQGNRKEIWDFEKWLDGELERHRKGQTLVTIDKTSFWRERVFVDLTGLSTEERSNHHETTGGATQPAKRLCISDTANKGPENDPKPKEIPQATKKPCSSNSILKGPHNHSKPSGKSLSTKRPSIPDATKKYSVDYSDPNADIKRPSSTNTTQDPTNEREEQYLDPLSPRRQRFNPPKGPSSPYSPRTVNFPLLKKKTPPRTPVLPAPRPRRPDPIADRNANPSPPKRRRATLDFGSRKSSSSYQRPYERPSLPNGSHILSLT